MLLTAIATKRPLCRERAAFTSGVECPRHLMSTMIAKIDGMRPRLDRVWGWARMLKTPLVGCLQRELPANIVESLAVNRRFQR